MFPKRLLAPGFLTALNLFLGFYAIILVANYNPGNNHFVTASWLIILAAIFDAFDGKVARATKSSSKFGVEFDSLADLTSFCVAPSFLIYQVHLSKMGAAGLIISFFPLMFGAIRLARFNVELIGYDKVNFRGLPTPACAATLASFVIFNFYNWNEIGLPTLVLPMSIVLSLLMVSTLEFDAMPKLNFKSGRKNSRQVLLLFGALLLVALFPQNALFPLAAAYITYCAVRGLLRVSKDNLGGELRKNGFRLKKKNEPKSSDS